jgi:hypothetical protein
MTSQAGLRGGRGVYEGRLRAVITSGYLRAGGGGGGV